MAHPRYGPEVEKAIEVLMKRPEDERPTHEEILRRLHEDEADLGYKCPIGRRAYFERVARIKRRIIEGDEPIPVDEIVTTAEAIRAEIVEVARSEVRRLRALRGQEGRLGATEIGQLTKWEKMLADIRRRDAKDRARSASANPATRASAATVGRPPSHLGTLLSQTERQQVEPAPANVGQPGNGDKAQATGGNTENNGATKAGNEESSMATKEEGTAAFNARSSTLAHA